MVVVKKNFEELVPKVFFRESSLASKMTMWTHKNKNMKEQKKKVTFN